MEALSSAADTIYSLENTHLVNAGKDCLLTSVLTEPELASELEHLLHERLADSAIAQPVTSSKAEALAPIADSARFQWKVFGSTFITIFLAELGDKTQVATLLMSAESHAPLVVFMGAAAALVSTSLLGVLVGQWLSSRLSLKTLETATGITLALLSLCLLWDVVKM